MTNNIISINFIDPTKVTGLTSGIGGIIVGGVTGVSELTAGVDSQLLLVDSSQPTGLKWNDRFKFFMAYTTVNTNINAGFTAIPWNVEKRKDSIYTHIANSSEITVTEDGDYHIIVDVTTDINSGNNRSISTVRLVKDSGGGFMELSGSRTALYNRINNRATSSGSISWIETMNSGDKIAVQAQRTAGTSSIVTKANHCRLTIRKL